ncbi:MAG: hypothetical protein HYY24_12060 [Verrucomicrobia bacterium]|nr:hypothetical protein [Verrucomicrobiota bacterium]
MITPERIRQVLDRRPFRPFRLFLSDGSHHEVPHPEFAWVFGGRVYIGMASKPGSALDGLVKELSILHVTRIEELALPKAKK